MVRLTEFWRLMHEVFGRSAGFVAADHVFSELDNRTAEQALADGAPVKEVWRGVCDGMDIPRDQR